MSEYIWVKCPNGHGEPVQQHFDYCGLCPECASVMMQIRPPLAILDGRPIFEGNTLYVLDGKKFKVSTTGHRDFPMCLIDLATVRENTYSSWLTDTHWKGQQVLFWSLADIPAPKDRTLGSRLKSQLEARKVRFESADKLKAPSHARRRNGGN